ncbi:hypothetical protein RM533_10890 [Croceicoccus sp. F390]|uniref:Uncharacterized protein n=1 Tax=Croceicoccus esteveae TaxID=3075597 RepID=A0ABU2ZJ91_9SPHN|nr:hypothetical protein [Croceicoccus sp. F390]MDT0576683.1 hypothetical protein [Croceicoccus sp. F390]
MDNPKNPADRQQDHDPAHQTDESKGSVTKKQVTDDNVQNKDLARGSEPQARSASSHRT